MCVVSMVMDHYGPIFPVPDRIVPDTPPPPVEHPWPPALTPIKLNPFEVSGTTIADAIRIDGRTVAEWKKLIEAFKKAVAAARVVDELTSQPDCEDPEKAALVDRVAALEKRLEELAARAERAPEL